MPGTHKRASERVRRKSITAQSRSNPAPRLQHDGDSSDRWVMPIASDAIASATESSDLDAVIPLALSLCRPARVIQNETSRTAQRTQASRSKRRRIAHEGDSIGSTRAMPETGWRWTLVL